MVKLDVDAILTNFAKVTQGPDSSVIHNTMQYKYNQKYVGKLSTVEAYPRSIRYTEKGGKGVGVSSEDSTIMVSFQ